MTIDEFEAQRGTLACIYCKSTQLDHRPKAMHIELFCRTCHRSQRYLSKVNDPKKRPRLSNGTLDEVWEGSNNHCAHCGLDWATINLLGLHRTVQHVPPYAVNGNDGYLIPLCSWCQQDSATQMKRITGLVERLSKKFDMNDA